MIANVAAMCVYVVVRLLLNKVTNDITVLGLVWCVGGGVFLP